MEKQFITNQNGLAPIVLILVALCIVGLIVAAVFFILRGNPSSTTLQPSPTPTISELEEQVPFKICETGDPEQCTDPVTNSMVDEVTIEAPDEP